jgi:hypothetical protein
MSEELSDLPQAENADPDGVQVALRAAQTLWSRGDTTESLKWLRKAAESASDEGADLRSLQLAKAAAELRAKLFGSSEPPRSMSAFPATSGGASPGVAPGESGAHPIAQLRSDFPRSDLPRSDFPRSDFPRSDSEPPRGAPLSSPPLSPPSVDAFATGAPDEPSGSSRPVTATQYPSHRPRQRIGLLSPSPGGIAQRESAAYDAVPSWSADSERRISGAPPPLPRESMDEYEELEAEPDEESADDPASVWSSGGPESWRPAAPSVPPGASPPPLPPRGAFADDDAEEFTRQSEPPTVVIPPLDESDDARAAREARRVQNSFTVPGNAWDQQSRVPGWEQDTGSAWATELHQSIWGNGVGSEVAGVDAALPSETARAKLTARVHHQAVRVSFAPDLRVPGQYVVRPLREGEKAAAGERIALLVALEPGMPLV